jgi:hypothetical protein
MHSHAESDLSDTIRRGYAVAAIIEKLSDELWNIRHQVLGGAHER